MGPVAYATIRTSVVLLLRLSLQAGVLLLIARILGPYQFGALAGIAALAILLGTLTTFGTHLVLLAEASKSYRRRLRVLPYCLSTSLASGVVLLAAFLLVVRAAFPESPIPLSLVVIIGLTELIVQPLIGIPSVQLQAQRKIVASQLVFLAPLAIRFLIVLQILLFPAEYPLQTYVVGSLAAAISGVAIASIMSPKSWPAIRHWRVATSKELRRAAGFAVLNVTAAGPAEIDKTLAARVLPLASAGVYSGAARVIHAMCLPVNAMVQSVLPTLFQEAGQEAGIRPRMLAAMFASAFLYGCGAALIMWLLVPVISWLFGDAYSGIGRAASLLCFAIPGTTLRMTSGAVLMARNQPWARVLFETSGIAVLLAAALVFAPTFGITGMIGAYIASEWTMAVVAGFLITVPLHGQP